MKKNFPYDETIKNPDELEFVLFCIENIAIELGISAQRVYRALTEKSDILHAYIIPEYKVLHTQGRDYIVEDILSLLNEKGVEL